LIEKKKQIMRSVGKSNEISFVRGVLPTNLEEEKKKNQAPLLRRGKTGDLALEKIGKYNETSSNQGPSPPWPRGEEWIKE